MKKQKYIFKSIVRGDGVTFSIGDWIESKGSDLDAIQISEIWPEEHKSKSCPDPYEMVRLYCGDNNAWVGLDHATLCEKPKDDFQVLEITMDNGKHYNKPFTKEDKLEGGKVTIVKRLMDGKIMKVGDFVSISKEKYMYWEYEGPKSLYDKQQTITEFMFFNKDFMRVRTEWFNDKGVLINDVNLCEKLFTTSDGVDIYESMLWYFVDGAYKIHEINRGSCTPDGIEKSFSTRALAAKYVASKVPVFTTTDGVKIFEGDIWYLPKSSKEVIEVVAKNFPVGANYSFSTREAATDHLIECLPLLKINEIQEIIDECDKYTTMELFMKKIRDRAKKEIKQR